MTVERNKFITSIAPGHDLMSYTNGRVTAEVVADIEAAQLSDVPVPVNRRMVYAVQGEEAPKEFQTELTGLLRQAGPDTRVILIPTDQDPNEVKTRLQPYLGGLHGVSYRVMSPEDLKNPALLQERAINLLAAKMPGIVLRTED